MIRATRSTPSLIDGDLSANPSLAVFASQLYMKAIDALTNAPDSLYHVLSAALSAIVPMTGISASLTRETESTTARSTAIKDWRFEVTDPNGKLLEGVRSGAQVLEKDYAETVGEETLKVHEERLIEAIERLRPDSTGIILHWVLLGHLGMGICCYRLLGTAADVGEDFTPDECALLDALAPCLLRILNLDLAFKAHMSAHHFFSRRTVELADRFNLTSAEYHVLHQMVTGSDNASIAKEMGITLSTVKTHITHILQKTGCRNRNGLIGRYYSSINAFQL